MDNSSKKKLKNDEIRVVKLKREAVLEILWETFMEIGCDQVGLSEDSQDIVYHMTVDNNTDELVFYACNFNDDYVPNLNYIDEYIKNNVGITTTSIYGTSESVENYKTIFLPSNCKNGEKRTPRDENVWQITGCRTKL